jgi:hypothetical protein
VLDLAGFSVHEFGSAYDFAPKGHTDGLMSKADSEDWSLAGKMADQVDADSGFLRRAGSGREQDAFGVHGFDIRDRDLIVSADHDFGSQFAQVLDQVVSERIVVV